MLGLIGEQLLFARTPAPAAAPVTSRRARVRALRRLPPFGGLSRGDARLLLERADPLTLPARRTVASAGSPSRQVLIVLDGALAARGRSDRAVGPGEVIGLREMLDDACFEETVTSVTDVELLVLNGRTIRATFERAPRIQAALTGEHPSPRQVRLRARRGTVPA